MMMYLPEDLVSGILSRLPVRSLIRFKCVCKTWYALIKSPNFVDMQLNLQLSKGDVYFQTLQHKDDGDMHWMWNYVINRFDNLESVTPPPVDVEVPGDDDRSGLVHFVNHLNGIVCMFTAYQARIILWNPALRDEFRVLPLRPFHCNFKSKMGIPLAMGFGFDDATNDYKVVCVELYISINNNVDEPPIRLVKVAQVYNLKSNSWRRLETNATLALGVLELVADNLRDALEYGAGDLSLCANPVFLKGSVHWLQQRVPIILIFCTTTELFGEIRFPNPYDDYSPDTGFSSIFVSDKSTLSLVFNSSRCPQQLNVWVMDDYNVKNSWTKQYSITYGSNMLRLLSFWKNEKLLFVAEHGLLICYDLLTGQQHDIRHYADGESATLGGVVCIETLVSIR